jgi:IS30 family transposase
LLAACLIPNLKPESFTRAAIAMLGGKQAHTLSLDNGIENKQWQGITDATGVDVFFCDAYSSWQKGGVENGNKMLRRYLPKGCDLGNYTQPQVDDYVARINNKPRRCLGYKSALQYANEKGIYLNGLVS